MSDKQLFVMGVSANSVGCMIANTECKTGYTLEESYGKTRSEEFIAMNPFHCCPTVKEGDFVLWESNAVLRYLATGSNLYPDDKQARAKIDQALDYRQCQLYKKIGDACYSRLGFSPNPVDATGADVKALAEELELFCTTYLGKNKFAAGDSPTIADLSIGPAIEFSRVVKDLVWPERLNTYIADLEAAVASYKPTIEALRGMCEGGKK